MEWEFTPAQVVKGEVDYRLEDFRHDLAQEVAMNLGRDDVAGLRRVYDAVYDQCYWLATGKPLADLLEGFEHEPEMRAWLASLEPLLRPNVEMLGAILQRDIMTCVARGEPLPQAIESISKRHDELGRASPFEASLIRG